MPELPVLVYCAGGNPRMMHIAHEAGFRHGARLPETVYGPLYFADQDWRRPNRTAYMAALDEHRPHTATVLDWERPEQLSEVLDWAAEAAQHVARVVLVPKVVGGPAQLPRYIGGKPVALGYPASSGFASSEVPLWEYAGWPVHILGGQPHVQMRIWRYLLAAGCEVVSSDTNYANKMATMHCQFWVPGTARQASNRYWPTLPEADGHRNKRNDAYLEAFRRSCVNIIRAWHELEQDVLPLEEAI